MRLRIDKSDITRWTLLAAATAAAVAAQGPAAASDEWRNHASPYDFRFGNHIDEHQESALNTRTMRLLGHLYVTFTDKDGNPIGTSDGLRIARHPRSDMGEVCGQTVECVVGWVFAGTLGRGPASGAIVNRGEARYLFHSGVNGDDHPAWLVNRINIPQPGPGAGHYHWISDNPTVRPATTDPRIAEIDPLCNVDRAAQLTPNTICPGWTLQLYAVRKFAFQHGGETIPVAFGIDNATHLNVVTNYASVPGIEATR